jgi:hypothetical protein
LREQSIEKLSVLSYKTSVLCHVVPYEAKEMKSSYRVYSRGHPFFFIGSYLLWERTSRAGLMAREMLDRGTTPAFSSTASLLEKRPLLWMIMLRQSIGKVEEFASGRIGACGPSPVVVTSPGMQARDERAGSSGTVLDNYQFSPSQGL